MTTISELRWNYKVKSYSRMFVMAVTMGEHGKVYLMCRSLICIFFFFCVRLYARSSLFPSQLFQNFIKKFYCFFSLSSVCLSRYLSKTLFRLLDDSIHISSSFHIGHLCFDFLSFWSWRMEICVCRLSSTYPYTEKKNDRQTYKHVSNLNREKKPTIFSIGKISEERTSG